MPGDHAILSPSGSSRWLACTPSARLEAQFPENTSEAAEEGTLAHGVGELILRHRLGRVSDKALEDCMKNIRKDKFYSESLQEYAEQYATFVLEKFSEAQTRTKDAVIEIEAKLDMTEYVPEGNGTGDTVIFTDRVLDIIDLKYGKGVLVSCVENKQMMLYALGALKNADILYDIDTIRMTIYQPRMDNISSWSIGKDILLGWAEGFLKPRAQLAFDGEGDFAPGDHCRFCKAKNRCRALAEENLEIAKYTFRDPEKLEDFEIADILSRTDMFVNWINGVNSYALTEALNGRKWEGYKLVEGRSNRTYSDADAVADKLVKSGIPEAIIYEKKLLGITAMEKAITKPTFNTLLSDLVIKPEGKPTLVPVSDKRSEINSTARAVADFSDEELT